MMLPGYSFPLHDDVMQQAKVFMQKFFDSAKNDRIKGITEEARKYAGKRKEILLVLKKQ